MNDNKSYRLAEYVLREVDEWNDLGSMGNETRERVIKSVSELLIGLHSEFRPGIDCSYEIDDVSDSLVVIFGGEK